MVCVGRNLKDGLVPALPHDGQGLLSADQIAPSRIQPGLESPRNGAGYTGTESIKFCYYLKLC